MRDCAQSGPGAALPPTLLESELSVTSVVPSPERTSAIVAGQRAGARESCQAPHRSRERGLCSPIADREARVKAGSHPEQSAATLSEPLPVKGWPPMKESLLRTTTWIPGVGLKEASRRAAHAAEPRVIKQVLHRVCWNRTGAARRLKISYRALLYKMRMYETGRQP